MPLLLLFSWKKVCLQKACTSEWLLNVFFSWYLPILTSKNAGNHWLMCTLSQYHRGLHTVVKKKKKWKILRWRERRFRITWCVWMCVCVVDCLCYTLSECSFHTEWLYCFGALQKIVQTSFWSISIKNCPCISPVLVRWGRKWVPGLHQQHIPW